VNASDQDVAVVLAAHGAPATDYPPMRVGLLMMLEFAGKAVERIGVLRRWRARLADEVATWPRTAENDPYKAAVEELAEQLALQLGYPVLAAFNEFCVPAIGDAIDQAIAGGAGRLVVVPTMLVRGNQHTELEIQEAVVRARERHSTAAIHYAWPFEKGLLVSLLAEVVATCLPPSPTAATE
jgi:sirohydrochlorin ferrochelatase